jgi:hypothetical protein
MKPLPLTAWLLGFGGVIPFLVQMNRNYFYGVMPALLAWLALLLPHNIALFVMAGLVMLAYGADAVLLFRRLNSDYSILRLYLTAAVSLLLLASGLALTLQK